MGSQLAFWSLSENASRNSVIQCKVHSTLSLGRDVTAADCKSGERSAYSVCAPSVKRVVDCP